MPDRALRSGARLALTTFTVLPMPATRVDRIDRRSAGVAMLLAPAVGALLGVAGTTVLLGSTVAGAPPLVAGGLTVAAAAALTRGLHLDGLADTVDALGSYRSGPAALEIMRRPDIGPFGVVALALVLLIQAAALAALSDRPAHTVLAGVVTAAATGRLAAAWGCRRGVPAARPEGLGALVAGTVGAGPLAAATLAVATVALAAVPHRPWQGPLTVLAALACAVALLRHLVRRLGGITGDVLGALVETATTVAYLGLLLTA